MIQETIKHCHYVNLVFYLVLTGLFCHLVLQMPHHNPVHLPLSSSKSMSMDKMGHWGGGGKGSRGSTLLPSQLCLLQHLLSQSCVQAAQLLLLLLSPSSPAPVWGTEKNGSQRMVCLFVCLFFPDVRCDQCCFNLFCLISRSTSQQLQLNSLKAHCENVNSTAFALGSMHLWEM